MKKPLVAIIVCCFAFSATFALAAERSGKKIYISYCGMCHESAINGAPKAGNPAAWSERLSKGMDHMVERVKKGEGAMPPKGMCNDCTDNELKAAIQYMLRSFN